MYSQSDYEQGLRTLIEDVGYGYEASRITENLTTQVVGGAGSRLTFNLSHTNIVSSGVMVSINEAGFTPTGFTVDNVNGIVIFASGMQPTLSTSYPFPTKFETMYYFQQFQQSDLDTFINYGLGKFGIMPMTGDNSNLDYQNQQPGWFNCILLYAAGAAYYALGSKYSRITNNSAQGKSAGKGSIAQRYLDLAKEYEDKAEKERLALYAPRQGRSTVASHKITNQIGRARRFGTGRSSY